MIRTGPFRRAAALAALSALLLGCSRNPVSGKKELVVISTEQEIALGREAAPQFEQEFGGKVPDAELQSYVARVGRKLANASDRSMPYEFALLASEVPNAFALPGGQVYVTAGLMARMTNERQLAAVLGHEVGHVAALHNVHNIQRQIGAAVLAEIVGAAGGEGGKQAAQIVGAMVNLRYSRTDEYQADQLGIKYMARAGYNPWGMVELLELLLQLSHGGSELMEMFQTHPLTEKRIQEAQAEVRKKHPEASASAPDGGAEEFLKLRARLGRYLEQPPPASRQGGPGELGAGRRTL